MQETVENKGMHKIKYRKQRIVGNKVQKSAGNEEVQKIRKKYIC